jgi:FkbM family methyltransferase
MRKIFLDCGSNLGQGFLKIFEECGMNDEWHFFLFEPNKECYEQLKNKINFKNLDIVNKTVSDESSLVDFTIEFCPTQKSWVGGASHIISDGYITPYYIHNEYMKSSTYKVETIDLSSFIRDYFNKNEYLLDFVMAPEVQTDIYVERGKYSAFESLQRLNLQEISNLYRSFQIFSSQGNIEIYESKPNLRDDLFSLLQEINEMRMGIRADSGITDYGKYAIQKFELGEHFGSNIFFNSQL